MALFFTGEFVYALDSQRRVAVPKEWREKESEGVFYIMPDRGHRLQMFTPAYLSDMYAKLSKMSFANSAEMSALGQLGSKIKECRYDKQGRIAIPEWLLEHAQIKRGASVDTEIILVGAIAMVHIWSKENWAKQCLPPDVVLDSIDNVIKGSAGSSDPLARKGS